MLAQNDDTAGQSVGQAVPQRAASRATKQIACCTPSRSSFSAPAAQLLRASVGAAAGRSLRQAQAPLCDSGARRARRRRRREWCALSLAYDCLKPYCCTDMSRCSWIFCNRTFHAQLCTSAAGGGWLEALQWLRANGCDWDAETCAWAARGGHLGVLQWARANGCPWDAETLQCGAFGNHLAMLEWARANGCPEVD